MRHYQDTKPPMTAKEFKRESHQAINVAIADGKRQEREALKAKEYTRVVTTRSYISGLEVARTILLTVNERI